MWFSVPVPQAAQGSGQDTPWRPILKDNHLAAVSTALCLSFGVALRRQHRHPYDKEQGKGNDPHAVQEVDHRCRLN